MLLVQGIEITIEKDGEKIGEGMWREENTEMPESLQHVFVYDIAFWGDGMGEPMKIPSLYSSTLPCHLKIVLALHSVSCPPLHNEGTNS